MQNSMSSWFRRLAILACTFILSMAAPVKSEIRSASETIQRRAAEGGTIFGLNLFQRLYATGAGKNVFFSPASIGWCLTMALNGAEGETKNEMATTLQVSGLSMKDLNSAYGDWKQSWKTIDPKIELEVANSIWSRKGLGLRPEFVQINKTYFGSDVTELNFNDPESLNTINSWVKNRTRGRIERIIDQISADSVLFLINAIYFDGKWTKAFDPDKTKVDAFATPSSRKDVRMMRQQGTYRYLEQPDFQAISLPYGNGRLSMYVFLPAEKSSLNAFVKSLSASNWLEWMASFGEAEGQIAMPRFNVEYEATLNDSLKTLGMRSAFDPAKADFGAMIGSATGRAYISTVKHKAVVEVKEEGTVAAAATSTEMRVVSMTQPGKTFQMIVNRPFLFAIKDNSNGLILFMGSITDPGQES